MPLSLVLKTQWAGLEPAYSVTNAFAAQWLFRLSYHRLNTCASALSDWPQVSQVSFDSFDQGMPVSPDCQSRKH